MNQIDISPESSECRKVRPQEPVNIHDWSFLCEKFTWVGGKAISHLKGQEKNLCSLVDGSVCPLYFSLHKRGGGLDKCEFFT